MKRIAIIALMLLVIMMVLFAGCGVPQDEVDKQVAAALEEGYQKAEEDLGMTVEEAKTTIAELENRPLIVPSPQDPTYSELMTFIVEDDTESWGLLPGTSAMLLFARAREAGIKSYLTRVTIAGSPQQYWYFCAFRPTDRGTVYILANMDRQVKLEVNRKYHELNGFSSSSVDDTILKIELIE